MACSSKTLTEGLGPIWTMARRAIETVISVPAALPLTQTVTQTVTQAVTQTVTQAVTQAVTIEHLGIYIRNPHHFAIVIEPNVKITAFGRIEKGNDLLFQRQCHSIRNFRRNQIHAGEIGFISPGIARQQRKP